MELLSKSIKQNLDLVNIIADDSLRDNVFLVVERNTKKMFIVLVISRKVNITAAYSKIHYSWINNL